MIAIYLLIPILSYLIANTVYYAFFTGLALLSKAKIPANTSGEQHKIAVLIPG